MFPRSIGFEKTSSGYLVTSEKERLSSSLTWRWIDKTWRRQLALARRALPGKSRQSFSSLALCSRRRFSAEHFELRSSDSHRHMVVTSRDPGSLSGKAVTDGGAGSAHLGQALPTGKIGETRGSDMDAATRIVLHLVSARQNLM